MARESRVALVGLGGMGTRHANALQEVDGTVVAGADVHEATRASFAERFDAEPFADHEAMLEETSPDAVIVATPNRYHEPVTTSALARDVHVLCEKPLAHSVESAERIVEADDASDAFCMVGFCHRFSAATRLFRAQQNAGTFGTVTHVEANFVRRRGIPNLGSWFTDPDLAGGGALMDIGVHTIDLALYLAGYPSVVEVTGHTTSTLGGDAEYADPDGWAEHRGTSGTGLDVEEAASAYLRCDDGTTVSLEVAWATNRRSTKRFRVDGTDAGAELELGGHTLEVVGAGSGPPDHYEDRTLTANADHNRFVAELERFLEGVEADERPDVNRIEQARHVQRTIAALYESARSGSAVALDTADPESERSR